MKLVVKNKGEHIDLEIFPEDTFFDVQNRILEDGKIILDIAKLASPNKPFSMSANVVEYFGIENNPKSENEAKSLETISTIASNINICVENSQESSFNKTYSKPAEKEVEKCNELPLEGSAGSDFIVSKEKIVKDGDELSSTFQINLENVPFPGKSLYIHQHIKIFFHNRINSKIWLK